MIRVSKSKKITLINEKVDDIFMLKTDITIQWTFKQ